jgi:glycosyltransferase involved in cell wall biosynthesis
VSTPLRVLLVTDAFPPVCGGSGWSTWELARGLTTRGHHVDVVKVEIGSPPAVEETSYGDLRVTVVRHAAPDVPVLRNVVKNERLWTRLTEVLGRRLAGEAYDVVHAQHVMTIVPAIRAGAAAGVPSVATVRDYWPVCYWSTLIVDPASTDLCPECTVTMMRQCVRPRAGHAAVAAWSVIPYMRANLRTKRRTLARAGAVIAVSTAIARDLETRAPELAGTPLFTIPNPVDMRALDEVRAHARRPMPAPYAVYAGKLAANKGVQFLLPAWTQAGLRLPLVIIGDGPLRAALEADAAARGLDVRVLGWQDRETVWTWMRHARLLAFPSYGPESLSRVLIEASALGVPVAAMDTGGTSDIVQHDVTGLLSADPDGFAADLARLAGDERLRAALGARARAYAHDRFDTASVVERIEQVYRGLLEPRAA